MARQEIVYGDNAKQGTDKINGNFTELYNTITSASIVSIAGATSLSASALGKIHICTGTTSHYSVDLPTAVGNAGASVILKGSSSLTKEVTIAGVSGQLIDGESSRKMSTDGSFTLLSDGTNWIVINEVGSWITFTTTPGGFSVDPTYLTTRYFRVGKLCTAQYQVNGSGTSSNTTTTVTLPFVAAEAISVATTTVINNAAVQAANGVARTRVGSATVDCYRTGDLGGTAWTNTAAKHHGNFTVTFKIS